jgi:hypothetical protein
VLGHLVHLLHGDGHFGDGAGLLAAAAGDAVDQPAIVPYIAPW